MQPKWPHSSHAPASQEAVKGEGLHKSGVLSTCAASQDAVKGEGLHRSGVLSTRASHSEGQSQGGRPNTGERWQAKHRRRVASLT